MGSTASQEEDKITPREDGVESSSDGLRATRYNRFAVTEKNQSTVAVEVLWKKSPTACDYLQKLAKSDIDMQHYVYGVSKVIYEFLLNHDPSCTWNDFWVTYYSVPAVQWATPARLIEEAACTFQAIRSEVHSLWGDGATYLTRKRLLMAYAIWCHSSFWTAVLETLGTSPITVAFDWFGSVPTAGLPPWVQLPSSHALPSGRFTTVKPYVALYLAGLLNEHDEDLMRWLNKVPKPATLRFIDESRNHRWLIERCNQLLRRTVASDPTATDLQLIHDLADTCKYVDIHLLCEFSRDSSIHRALSLYVNKRRLGVPLQFHHALACYLPPPPPPPPQPKVDVPSPGPPPLALPPPLLPKPLTLVVSASSTPESCNSPVAVVSFDNKQASPPPKAVSPLMLQVIETPAASPPDSPDIRLQFK